MLKIIKKSKLVFGGLAIGLIILFQFAYSQIEEDIFVFDGLIFKNDTVLLNSFYISQGSTSFFLTIGNYKVRLLSKNYSVIFEGSFDVGFIACPDIPFEGESKIGCIELNQTRIRLKLPYHIDAEYLEIFRSSEKIFFLKISDKICIQDKVCHEYCRVRKMDVGCAKFAICGNRICETEESQENCCVDCGCTFGYFCKENKCEPYFSSIIIYLLLIIFPAIFLLFQIKKFKK